ncbi:MAG TPA: GAF domain-containing protein, partial [Acidobacteriota bacterium]
MTVRTSAQLWIMAAFFTVFVVLYCLPFESHPLSTALIFSIVFPLQMLLWRLGYGRKTKDFLFCFSLLLSTFFLKHYWQYSDLVFYAFSILMAAVLRYPVFLGIAGSSIALEVLRERYYGGENLEEVAFRYLLFLVAGSLAYLLLREEKKQKEEFKKELDDLKYSIHEMEKAPVAMLSDAGQTSRKVDAALALEDSLQGILQLIYNVFRPNTVVLWQYLADKEQLRLWKYAGESKALKENLTFALGDGPIGWAALNKKSFLQQDKEDGVSISFRQKGLPVLSLLAVPVLEGDRLEGVLSVDSSHLHFFAGDAATAMGSFAAQISEAIRMARVARDREEMAFEFQAFYHASKELSSLIQFDDIVRKLRRLCTEIVPSQYTAIAIMEDERAGYSVYEWETEDDVPQARSGLKNDGHTWISWFMSSREEPLIVSQAQLQLQEMPTLYPDEAFEGFVTYLAVPLRHQQRCIGALLLAGDHKDAFSAHQSRILLILCNQAAVSLENSSIIQKMEELA